MLISVITVYFHVAGQPLSIHSLVTIGVLHRKVLSTVAMESPQCRFNIEVFELQVKSENCDK
jgi:hypothetical protein